MNIGGTELNALRTARHLAERGIELSVFSLSTAGPLLEQYAELGVTVRFLPIDRLFGRTALRRGRELAATVRRERIAVVHAHDVYSNIFAGPWTRLAGAAFIASRRWWEGPESRAKRWANRCGYVFANRVLANSPAVADLLRRGERVPGARVVVVPNFVDVAAFDPPPAGWSDRFAADLGLPADRSVVGAVASLSPVKDHDTLLRAVAALTPRWPGLHLVLVGADGGSRTDLAAAAARLRIADRVHFAGLRPSVPSAHHLFDISTLTSVSEGLPNSILEAMAAGRPVVATAVGATRDAVVDGRTGFLVPPRDPDALAGRLEVLLRDEAMRATMGARGRERVREHFSAAAAIGALVDTYNAVTRGAVAGTRV